MSEQCTDGTDRLMQLRGTNFQETHDGLKFECQECFRKHFVAQAVDGKTCKCGQQFGPVFIKESSGKSSTDTGQKGGGKT